MKWLRTAIIVLLSGLTAPACSLHTPQLEQARQVMPAAFLEAPGPEAATPLSFWWEAFDDAILNNLMAEALAHNLDVAQAQARLAQFEALAKSSRAALFPTLNLGANVSRDKSPGAAGDTTGGSQSLSVAAAYEVDLWQKISSTSSAARLTADASREDLKTLYMRLTSQVADLYFLIVEKKAALALTDSIIATLRDSLSRVERRYEQGLATSLDVYQAKQNLLEAQGNRPGVETALATAQHGLALLVGRFPQKDLAGDLIELPKAPAAFPSGLPADLLANRPDIEAAFLRLAAKDKEIAAAVAARLPAVNLLANYGTARTDLGTAIVSGSFWSLSGELSQALFDAGRRKAEVERRQALFAEQLAAYRLAVLTAVQEVENSLAANRASEEQLARIIEREQATAASLRLATNDYFQGLTDYLPVLVAQQLHFRTQTSVLAAKRQLIADRISLARALGGTWPEAVIEKQMTEGLQPGLANNNETTSSTGNRHEQ